MIKQLDTLSQMAELIYQYTDNNINELIMVDKTFLPNIDIFKRVSSKISGDIQNDFEYLLEYSVATATLFANHSISWCTVWRYASDSYIHEMYNPDARIIFFYKSWSWSRQILFTENSIVFNCYISNSGYIDDPEENKIYTYIFSDEDKQKIFI